ncbi:BTAD domain-containing putative transcriptional regulator [Mycobacterium sp. 236(2023)]|uniref:BTAD domain-containing putative transcriptional regulator n=1 Tax=Mycobacterium sp. 236(2023) TaxID=3038163 RepID=UPI0024152122|nr:BTAD domain-containing putative transcriptional regulator [Mycobacterium sp. 236(2023)]MDG4667580.1 BTAD domain-containing putative transcriptional regulator [Mycobacterium sp. 236(2023)]
MTDPGLDFGVLGPMRMTAGGAEVPVGTPKLRAVLAMLVINRNRPVAVDSLIDAVWQESPPPGARASLHSYVSNLRKLVAGVGADPQGTLASAPPGYRLTVADGACDLGRFNTEKAAGVHAAAAGDFERAARHLAAALAQWRGPVLEDLRGFSFVDQYATALHEDRLTAATARAEAELACGRAGQIIGELEMLAADNPYREPLWAQLISAYYLDERQSEALAAYQRLKLVLADDLGIDPGPTLRALHDRILRQEPLDVKMAAQKTAVGVKTVLDQHTQIDSGSATAWLVDSAGLRHPLNSVATRIGRAPDNDIVVDDPKASRAHAAIIDTGTGYAVTDLRSANGVELAGVRVRGSAALARGDEIRICGHVFTFEFGVTAVT